ncbi:molybdopterin-dependent oxidoreductase [Porticoccaceae bacterium LTM1]|nr:molybdopterin-dependent oxidoreductase [Porticoccaceae bacterium LTM1]
MDISRRGFLKGSTAGGALLTLGFHLSSKAQAQQNDEQTKGEFEVNAYIRISADNRITLITNKSEMGQGSHTAIPMLLAEELDADWQAIKVEQVSLPNSDFRFIGTAGSSSISRGFMSVRQAGANARALLIAAAAKEWNVPADSLRTETSHVINPVNGKRLPYGDLLTTAATLPIPGDAPLKAPADFKLLGKDVKRTEAKEKVTGKANFGIDAQLPGMHYAVVARAPVFGATLKSVDDNAAKNVKGVVKIKTIPSGVAVIATSFWQAKKGRDALKLEWDINDWADQSTEDLQETYRSEAQQPGSRARRTGDPATAIANASQVLEMVYEVPYLAHAPMEPLNCTIHDKGDSAEIWVGSQLPTADQTKAAQILGHSPDKITLNLAFLGGGFGRRGASDFVKEAAHVAKSEPWPVKTLWTREDDIQGGFYRPMMTHKTRLALDDNGNLNAFESIAAGQGGGVGSIAYSVPNTLFDTKPQQAPVQTHWWRSVNNSFQAFVVESALDEAAQTAGIDPFSYRRSLLATEPRMLALLDKVKEMSDWDRKRPENTGLGVAIHASFGSIVAEVAEVTVKGTDIAVNKVWCAVDCGFAVNPLNVRAQMESAIIYGLSAALFGEITFKGGKVQQSNFHDYQVVRMSHCPDIEVAIINNGESIGGIGEPGLPPIAPAVANAVFAATGKRLRQLPLTIS